MPSCPTGDERESGRLEKPKRKEGCLDVSMARVQPVPLREWEEARVDVSASPSSSLPPLVHAHQGPTFPNYLTSQKSSDAKRQTATPVYFLRKNSCKKSRYVRRSLCPSPQLDCTFIAPHDSIQRLRKTRGWLHLSVARRETSSWSAVGRWSPNQAVETCFYPQQRTTLLNTKAVCSSLVPHFSHQRGDECGGKSTPLLYPLPRSRAALSRAESIRVREKTVAGISTRVLRASVWITR